MPRTFETDKYFVILPQIPLKKTEAYYQNKGKSICDFAEYNSNNTHILSKSEIKKMLKIDGWLDRMSGSEFVNYLSGLRKDDLEKFFESEGWSRKP